MRKKNTTLTKEFLLKEFFELRKTQKTIAAELGCHVGTVETAMREHKLTNQILSRYKVREDLMVETDPYFMYTVGLFITDGSIAKDGRLSIRINDGDVIKVLCNYFDCPYYMCRRNTDKVALHEFNVPYDTPLTRYCRSLTTEIGKKTFNVTCPVPAIEQLRILLLRGIIDGDGAIRPGMTDIRVFTASLQMKLGLVRLLDSLYIPHTIQNTIYGKFKKAGWTVYIGKDCVDVLIRIYEDFPDLAIQRKRNIVKSKVYDIVRTYGMINHKMW